MVKRPLFSELAMLRNINFLFMFKTVISLRRGGAKSTGPTSQNPRPASQNGTQ